MPKKENPQLEALRQRALNGEELGVCSDLLIVSGNIDAFHFEQNSNSGSREARIYDSTGERYRRRVYGGGSRRSSNIF